MNLDNVINNKLNHTLHKDTRTYKQKPLTKEQKDLANIKYIIRKIKTGDYDKTKYSHQVKLSLAVKHSYVDRKTLEILKED